MQTAVFFAERMALELKILKQIIFGQVEVDANDTPIFLASKDDSSVLYKERRDLKNKHSSGRWLLQTLANWQYDIMSVLLTGQSGLDYHILVKTKELAQFSVEPKLS